MSGATGGKMVVLDDDPTGTQTVHGVPVLTTWSVEALARELLGPAPAVFILTNTRALSGGEARALNAEVGRNLRAAAAQTGRDVVVVSRSDSTLRGHFPGEVQALADALGTPFDAWLLTPYFGAGGRFTAGDVHYVHDGARAVPVGETEYARDATFGFRASNLRAWVEEKTGGRVPASEVASVSLADVRGDQDDLVRQLLALRGGRICVVNIEKPADLRRFVAGLRRAEGRGGRYLYRSAASFVAERAGIRARPLLTPPELRLPGAGGGLIVVGSYVARSTEQLQALLAVPNVIGVEVGVGALLDPGRCPEEVARASQAATAALRGGQDVALFTSRDLLRTPDVWESLHLGARISSGLIKVVRGVEARPRYLLAKGGITSSDTATKALQVGRAWVEGQVIPGVSVWRLGPESRWPDLAYVVFPGNVGGVNALAEVVVKLRPAETALSG